MSDKKWHDASGRFAKGNPGGPGRPPNPPPIELPPDYLSIVEDGVTEAQWQSIVAKAVQQAKTGNRAARDWLTRILVDNPQLGSRDTTVNVKYMNWRDGVKVRKTYENGVVKMEIGGVEFSFSVTAPEHLVTDTLEGVPEKYRDGIRAWLKRAPRSARPALGVLLDFDDLPVTHFQAARDWYVSKGFLDPFDNDLDKPLPNPATHPRATVAPPAPQAAATDSQESETPEIPETPEKPPEDSLESRPAFSTRPEDYPDGDTDGGAFGSTNSKHDGWAKRFT